MKINDVVNEITELLGNPKDLTVREFLISYKVQAAALYIDTIANSQRIGMEIIAPLTRANEQAKDMFSFCKSVLLNVAKTSEANNIEECVEKLLDGNTVLIIDGQEKFIAASTAEFQKRGVIEPPTNSVNKGPREGFVEDIGTNVSLLRKRLKTPDLILEETSSGRYTGTKIIVAYIKSIAETEIVKKVLERINKINIDGIIDSYYVMQFLQDERVKLFRQVGDTEKPDILAAKLLEGRIAIIVDGSPIVLTVPYILFEDIQSSDDYYSNNTSASLHRFLRIAGGIFAIVLPGLYIALQLYHYKIVPLNTLVTITNSVGNSPFSPMLETIFVLVLFEIMYEASLRMPKHLGTATSLVGALVLGDTAVKAGLLSTPSVLVAALSGLMMYILPDLASQISLFRFFIAVIGGILGLYGIIISVILIVCYLASIDSYGAPYLAPYAPLIKDDLKDAIFKERLNDMSNRPKSIPNKNKTRLKKR